MAIHRAKASLKMSASIGEISLLHSLSTLAFSPSGPIKSVQQFGNSVTDMLDHLDMESLESRRTKAQLTMMFRIINNLVDVPAQQYLIPASRRTRAAHCHKYRQISTSTSYYKNSFFPHTIITWNSLPSAVAEAPDLVSFKQGLSNIQY